MYLISLYFLIGSLVFYIIGIICNTNKKPQYGVPLLLISIVGNVIAMILTTIYVIKLFI